LIEYSVISDSASFCRLDLFKNENNKTKKNIKYGFSILDKFDEDFENFLVKILEKRIPEIDIKSEYKTLENYNNKLQKFFPEYESHTSNYLNYLEKNYKKMLFNNKTDDSIKKYFFTLNQYIYPIDSEKYQFCSDQLIVTRPKYPSEYDLELLVKKTKNEPEAKIESLIGLKKQVKAKKERAVLIY
jgi:hypothetical protein